MADSGRKALIIGATGLVGSNILDLLLADSRFAEVEVFVRRTTGRTSPKLREHLVDFERIAEWGEHLRGDVLFSALGTTLKAAGSKEAQYRIDYTYQLETAAAARRNGVGTCVVVSSTGARPGSRFFYLRMKGELERDLLALDFPKTRILRPGPLAGKRREVRRMETLMNRVLSAAAPVLPPSSRPVPARSVAAAAIAASLEDTPGGRILEAAELLEETKRR